MIVEWMLEVGLFLFNTIFMMLGVLPDVPGPVRNVVDWFFNLVYNAVGLASVFVDFNMVKILIPLVIAILNFDHILKFIMFILKKIPILGIK